MKEVLPLENTSLVSDIWQEIKKGYNFIFITDMPLWVAGVALGILAIFIFLWRYPWGISSGYGNWGDQLYYYAGLGKWIGFTKNPPLTPWFHPVSVMNFGMILGATGAAMMKGQFSTYRAPGREYIKGFIGGALMGVGSSFANGCIEGGFYTAVGVYSLGGFMMMIGLALGAILGVKYLIWEMLNWPVKIPKQKPLENKKTPMINWKKVHPYIGAGIYIAICLLFYVYSAFGKTVIGGMAFFGLLVGFFMQRARFCLQRTFRNPFMTGDYEMVKAVILSLIIYSAGSAVIKYGFFQPTSNGVDHRFWLGSLLGGSIFGFGMVIAGACASSGLWRAGEGNTKVWLAIVGFATVYPITKHAVSSTALGPFLGKGIYVVDIFGWTWTPVLYIGFFLLWYFLAVYNSKTEKFVITF